MIEFVPFQKIPRLFRECVITEKLDGTNAQVIVGDDGSVVAGSRNRLITPDADNFGFASWVYANADRLASKLGPGRHFGEWWGLGIQRGYGLHCRRFSLFNTSRWAGLDEADLACAPVLYEGPYADAAVHEALARLASGGSLAAPGFAKPEGVVVYHKAANSLFKVTLGDDGHKEARA